MKYFIPSVSAFILCANSLFSQPAPDTLWTRTYGGSDFEYGRAIVQSADGGYAIAGYTWSFGAGNVDFYFVKTNGNGDTLWTRTYGGASSDQAQAIRQTSDGGYVIAGFSSSFSPDYHCYVVKTNSNGDMLWSHTYGGPLADQAYAIKQTSDGGYAIAGFTLTGANGSDFYVVKTSSNGDTLWTHTYGGSLNDRAYDIWQTADGGYVIIGTTNSFGAGSYDIYLVKTNSAGVPLWTRTYGGSDYEDAYSILQTSDGGYVIAGSTGSFNIDYDDFYVIKTDGNGDTLRTHTYGRSGFDRAMCIMQTADEGFVIAGTTDSFGAGDDDCYIVRTDRFGDTLWTRTYGGSSDERAMSVQVTADSGYVVAGYTGSFGAGSSDFYVIKTGPDRIDLWAPGLPRVAIAIEDTDVRMYWNPVTETIGGHPIEVTRYLVFFSEQFAGPYWYHGATPDTSYTHVEAIHWASNMFYRVIASTAPALLFDELPPSGRNSRTSEAEVLGILHRHNNKADGLER